MKQIFSDAVKRALSKTGIMTLAGKVDLDRRETYERFERIYPLIKEKEKTIGALNLVRRCAFTPKKSSTSLADVLVELIFLDEYFNIIPCTGVDVEDIFHHWETETGNIPYERERRDLIISFLSGQGIDQESFDTIEEDESFPSINDYFDY